MFRKSFLTAAEFSSRVSKIKAPHFLASQETFTFPSPSDIESVLGLPSGSIEDASQDIFGMFIKPKKDIPKSILNDLYDQGAFKDFYPEEIQGPHEIDDAFGIRIRFNPGIPNFHNFLAEQKITKYFEEFSIDGLTTIRLKKGTDIKPQVAEIISELNAQNLKCCYGEMYLLGPAFQISNFPMKFNKFITQTMKEINTISELPFPVTKIIGEYLFFNPSDQKDMPDTTSKCNIRNTL